MSWRVGLVGAGGVGLKRAVAVGREARSDLVLVCDTDMERARSVAAPQRARITTDWELAAEADEIDLLIVSTPHDLLVPIAERALRAGKHVLCEKPMGRTAEEARRAAAAALDAGRVLHAGYNHRFHPAIRAVYDNVQAGDLGELMLLRGRYGHGGRPGYDREWRADTAISGGGQLLDQGAHLIDLSQWLLGDVSTVNGRIQTAFWDMPQAEDNAFALLSTPTGQTASLHVSWTQWRNLFSLELFGRDGYAKVEGLGGAYGPETLTMGKRRAQGGAPEETTQVFEGADCSWGAEWAAFLAALEGKPTLAADGERAVQILECIGALYRSAVAEGAPERITV